LQTPNDGSPDPTGPSDDDFFLEIESRFAQLRGTPFVFSSKDWALMKGWHDDGVPLAIVLEAIDGCFAKRDESRRRGKISSLSYCRHAVDELWSDRRELYVGREPSELSDESPARRLAELADTLSGASEEIRDELRQRLESAAATIRGLAEGHTVPEIETRLMELEQTLLDSLEAALSDEERSVIDGEVGEALSGMAGADPEAKEKTRTALRKRVVRRRFALPRLSLFS
jgi:hypothetical protein